MAVLVCLTLLVGCGPEVAARIDDDEITMNDLRAEIASMLGNTEYIAYIERAAGAKVVQRGALLPDLVAQVLTVQMSAVIVDREIRSRSVGINAADRKKATDEASAATGLPSIFGAFPETYRTELVDRAAARVALRRKLIEGVTPQSYYRSHRADYVKPCVRDIVVASADDAEAARRRIAAGASFAAVARDVSLDGGSAPKGGDLGCNGVNDLLSALNAAVLEQRIGEVGAPIKTPEGYHLLRVESREQAPLGRVQGEVEGAIQKLAKTRLDELVTQRLRRADVEVAPDIGRWDGEAVVAR